MKIAISHFLAGMVGGGLVLAGTFFMQKEPVQLSSTPSFTAQQVGQTANRPAAVPFDFTAAAERNVDNNNAEILFPSFLMKNHFLAILL